MSPEVLILSSIYDFASDHVALELKERRIPFLRLNREQLHEYELALDPAAPFLSVCHGGNRWNVTAALKSVWFRQPVFLRNTPADPLAAEEQLERSEWMAFLRGLRVFDRARWVNDPRATYLAECKPYQLQMARRLGFKVPATIIGNDAEAIARNFEPPYVVKSLDTVLVSEGSDILFTYTTVQRFRLSAGSVKTAPLIAQQLLDPKTDIRVTVVGDSLFASKVLDSGQPITGDWRTVPKVRLSYPDHRLDPDTAARCRTLLLELGLSLGAIDLAECDDAVYFIEINPTGEWAWLASDERPLEKAIADLLVR